MNLRFWKRATANNQPTVATEIKNHAAAATDIKNEKAPKVPQKVTQSAVPRMAVTSRFLPKNKQPRNGVVNRIKINTIYHDGLLFVNVLADVRRRKKEAPPKKRKSNNSSLKVVAYVRVRPFIPYTRVPGICEYTNGNIQQVIPCWEEYDGELKDIRTGAIVEPSGDFQIWPVLPGTVWEYADAKMILVSRNCRHETITMPIERGQITASMDIKKAIII